MNLVRRRCDAMDFDTDGGISIAQMRNSYAYSNRSSKLNIDYTLYI